MALNPPDAVQFLPALSLGLAAAIVIPLLAVGGLLWWSGQKLMKPLVAFAAGCVGALVGLGIAALLQNSIAMIFLPVAGLGVGVALGLMLFRLATALVAGAMAFMVVASVGSGVVMPKHAVLAPAPQVARAEKVQEGASVSAAAPAPHEAAAQSLKELATESIARAKAAAAARPAQSFDGKQDAKGESVKEYVDVRQLRVGDNPLAVEEVRVDSGHRHLVIRSGPTPEERKKLEEQQSSPLEKLKLDGLGGAGGLLGQFKADAENPDAAAQKFAALLGGVGGSANAADAEAQVPMRSVVIVLALAGSIAATVFGLALWKHRQTVALVAAGLGSGFLVSGASVMLLAAKPDAAWLTGLMASMLFAGLWLALTMLGAISQLRRARATQIEETGGVAGTIRSKPVEEGKAKRKVTRIPAAKKAA